MITVLLADTHPAARTALALLLKELLGVRQVYHLQDLDFLTEAIQTDQPGLVLLEWDPTGNGDTPDLRSLHLEHPGLKVLAMSVHPEDCQSALLAGADGFIHKGASPGDVINELKKYIG